MTPNAVNHIKWRTFLMFGIFCVAMGIWVFFFIKETKGRSLEDMDILFGTVDANQRAVDVEHMLHKGTTVMGETESMAENKGTSKRMEHISDEGVIADPK